MLVTVRSNIVPNISVSNPVSALALGHEPDDPPLGWISSSTCVTEEPGVTVFHAPFSLLTLITCMMNSTVTSSANPNTENVTIFIAFFTLSTLFNFIPPLYHPFFKNIFGKRPVKIIALYDLASE